MASLQGVRFLSKLNVTGAAVSRIICNGSFCVAKTEPKQRNFSQSPALARFKGEPSPGSYTAGPEFEDILKKIYREPKLFFFKLFSMWRDEFKLWFKEIRTDKIWQVRGTQKGEIDMLFTFEDDVTVNKFMVVTDKTNNQGFSTASLVRTENETVLFSGFTDLRLPEDGKVKYTGFASMITRRLLKSFKRFDTYNWSSYTHMVLKVRGDGRTYCLILGCPMSLDLSWQDQFHYPLYTRGGPYWQIVKIPLSDFYFTSRGVIQDEQEVLPNNCSRVGITIADGVQGPFRLEIEYFGLENQPCHRKISPYEHYNAKNLTY